MKKVCIYARVSTQGQDYQRQLSELREYASRMNYEVVREFSEKISGAKSVAEHQALTELLDYAAANRIDKV
jgi:DNA invertase Pin-like site-specific DNA recombinase